LKTTPSEPSGRARRRARYLGHALAEHDAHLGAAQQFRRGVLVIAKRAIAQIFAVMLDKVETGEDRGTGGRPSAQLIEAQPSGPRTTASPLSAMTAAASFTMGARSSHRCACG
jgi:hypothetical protein